MRYLPMVWPRKNIFAEYTQPVPPRFYVPEAGADESTIALPADEAAHLTRVLRLSRGDRILEVNGTAVASHNANGTLGAAFGPDVVGQAAAIVFEKRSGERRTAQMVKRVVVYPTVSVSRRLLTNNLNADFSKGSRFGISIDPEISIRKTRLLGGIFSGSIFLAAICNDNRCDSAFQGHSDI